MAKTQTIKGKVKWFNDQKGYGYITAEDGTDYFVHRSGLKIAHPKEITILNLVQNDEVEFTVQDAPKGPQAVGVCIIDNE